MPHGVFRTHLRSVLEAIARLPDARPAPCWASFRWLGLSLVWYDEIAVDSTRLAHLLRRARGGAARRHLGFAGFVNALPPTAREANRRSFASAIRFASSWSSRSPAGTSCNARIRHDLVAPRRAAEQVPQSVIPIGSVLFVLAGSLRLPEAV